MLPISYLYALTIFPTTSTTSPTSTQHSSVLTQRQFSQSHYLSRPNPSSIPCCRTCNPLPLPHLPPFPTTSPYSYHISIHILPYLHPYPTISPSLPHNRFTLPKYLSLPNTQRVTTFPTISYHIPPSVSPYVSISHSLPHNLVVHNLVSTIYTS